MGVGTEEKYPMPEELAKELEKYDDALEDAPTSAVRRPPVRCAAVWLWPVKRKYIICKNEIH